MIEGSVAADFYHDDGYTVWTALAGPTFNFVRAGENAANAFYVGVSAGVSRVGVNDFNYGDITSTSFAYGANLGKRFAITSSVSWKPMFSMFNTTESGSKPRYTFSPVSFSFLF